MKAPQFKSCKHPAWFAFPLVWSWGRSLRTVCTVLLAESKRSGRRCRMVFNGTVLVVTPKKSVSTLLWEFMRNRNYEL